ncbi:MAG: hypothetical protein H7Y09_03560 [Chitinophagaceae bacterium]|nr:hypothetical protein [Anaerolineae bacterium]
MFYDAGAIKQGFKQLGNDALERHQAMSQYEKALGRGRRQQLQAKFTGRSRRLLALADLHNGQHSNEQRYGGVQTVSLHQIRGSENRVKEFDIDFNPLVEHIEQRWIGIAAAHLTGKRLPPVDLIQVGDTYFVRDGHHRISVARAYGQCEIDAIVTVMQARE